MSSDPEQLFNLEDDFDFCGQVVAGLVQEYRHIWGEGPAWAYVAGMMGWGPRHLHAPLIEKFTGRGWLRYTPGEPYSLRPGPRYQVEVGDA